MCSGRNVSGLLCVVSVLWTVWLTLLQATKLASTTAQKTKELGQTVNESVVKPTKDKVRHRAGLLTLRSSLLTLAVSAFCVARFPLLW